MKHLVAVKAIAIVAERPESTAGQDLHCGCRSTEDASMQMRHIQQFEKSCQKKDGTYI